MPLPLPVVVKQQLTLVAVQSVSAELSEMVMSMVQPVVTRMSQTEILLWLRRQVSPSVVLPLPHRLRVMSMVAVKSVTCIPTQRWISKVVPSPETSLVAVRVWKTSSPVSKPWWVLRAKARALISIQMLTKLKERVSPSVTVRWVLSAMQVLS